MLPRANFLCTRKIKFRPQWAARVFALSPCGYGVSGQPRTVGDRHDNEIVNLAAILSQDLAVRNFSPVLGTNCLHSDETMPEGGNPDIPPPPAIHIERTLALIKPDAIHKSDEIEEIVLQHGFTILQVDQRSVSS